MVRDSSLRFSTGYRHLESQKSSDGRTQNAVAIFTRHKPLQASFSPHLRQAAAAKESHIELLSSFFRERNFSAAIHQRSMKFQTRFQLRVAQKTDDSSIRQPGRNLAESFFQSPSLRPCDSTRSNFRLVVDAASVEESFTVGLFGLRIAWSRAILNLPTRQSLSLSWKRRITLVSPAFEAHPGNPRSAKTTVCFACRSCEFSNLGWDVPLEKSFDLLCCPSTQMRSKEKKRRSKYSATSEKDYFNVLSWFIIFLEFSSYEKLEFERRT